MELRIIADNPEDQKKADVINACFRAPIDGDSFFWLLKSLWVFIETKRRGLEWFCYGDDPPHA